MQGPIEQAKTNIDITEHLSGYGIPKMAKLYKFFYDHLIAQGFTEEQAMQLCLAQSFMREQK
jgi:hypothetical protein